MDKESQISTVVRFEDGKYLGVFGKVDTLTDAIKYDGDWITEVELKNNPICLKEKSFEIKKVQMDIKLID